VHGSDTLHGVVVNPLSDSFFRQHRSNSWSDSLDEIKLTNSSHQDGGGRNSNGILIQSYHQGQSNGFHHMTTLHNNVGVIKENSVISSNVNLSGCPVSSSKSALPISRGVVLDPSLHRKCF